MKKGKASIIRNFGEGIIEKNRARSCSVNLHIRFGEELKVIDQKWLLQTNTKKKMITVVFVCGSISYIGKKRDDSA